MPKSSRAFTLVELLTVIGIISLLLAMLLPALNRAREAAQAAVCASNVRQLHLASMGYAAENDGFWPPAHFDYTTIATNLHRWHGTRQSIGEAFNMNGSPLKSFLQTDAIKQCPVFEPAHAGFETSAGGYGYNNHYLGSSIAVLVGQPFADNLPAKISQVRKPAETIAFTDAAMGDPRLIEYSFVEPPIAHTQWGSFDNSPSIHFRHRERANICWADGHVTTEPQTWTRPTNAYGASNLTLRLGFTGPEDNSLFDRG
jgi:prepilin-type processing-associated H-X9-DG protein/prepilin-type N-terminal cleavage/methylation domain-containing protein